jgi:hypothetical protein
MAPRVSEVASNGATILSIRPLIAVPPPPRRGEGVRRLWRQGIEAVGDAPVDRVGRIDAVGVGLSRCNPGQKRDSLIDRVNRIYCKAALGRGGHNVRAQHQVARIGAGITTP